MQTVAGRIMLLGLLLVLALCAARLCSGVPGVQYGIQDNTWLEFGPGTFDQRLKTFKRLGVPLVRFTLRWNEIAPAAAEERGLADRSSVRLAPAGQGSARTAPLRAEPVLTIVGTPTWANGGRPANFAPPHPRDFRRFATAAARRYPWVRYWLIWNEPNKRLWLRPTKPGIYVRHLLNPAYEAIHAVLPRARVGGGVTGPRGANGGVSPTDWVRGMARATRSSTRTRITRTQPRRRRRRRAAAARTAPGSRWPRFESCSSSSSGTSRRSRSGSRSTATRPTRRTRSSACRSSGRRRCSASPPCAHGGCRG